MSDLRLQEFAVRAEERMPLPDFTELDRRGRSLRLRRRVAAAGVTAACVLAAVGVVALSDDSPEAVEPVRPPDDTRAQGLEYPGPVMEDLAPGTYTMVPYWDPDYPRARITLTDGWNAWQGPNRFGGQEAAGDNEKTLGKATWYVGILVLKVDAVSSELCRPPSYGDEVGSTPQSLVRAVRRIPGFRMTENPEPVETFGYPATHFRLIPRDDELCDANLFTTTGNGVVGGYADTEDIWVVDVDGYPLLVDSQRSVGTPPQVRRELADTVDSIEFFFEEE